MEILSLVLTVPASGLSGILAIKTTVASGAEFIQHHVVSVQCVWRMTNETLQTYTGRYRPAGNDEHRQEEGVEVLSTLHSKVCVLLRRIYFDRPSVY